MEVEEVGSFISGHGERVHDSGRDEDPGLGPDDVLAVLEQKRELTGEDEERLCVSLVDVGGGATPPGTERTSTTPSCSMSPGA